jgi:hypothetical protein
MNPLNQVNIEEKKTVYDVKYTYHSDMKCQNYDAVITGIEEADGNVTVRPWTNNAYDGGFFEFNHSDPDRVIAIAQMMLSFAQMVKKNNKKNIDTDLNA